MKKYKIKKVGKDFEFLQNYRIVRGSRKKILTINSKNEIAMFKYERNDYQCSEACSEKIAYEIAKYLNYECAKIDLAYDYFGNLGVLNYFFSNDINLHHTDIVAYLNKKSSERNYYYTISNIKSVLDDINPNLFKGFIKIMVFDALIGEQDRHEENWGIVENNGNLYISPLYDNGDSLLREFQNPKIALKYYNGTKNFDAYIKRSKTLIYKENNLEKYSHFELIEYLINIHPNLVIPELEKIKTLNDDVIRKIVERIPNELLTIEHKKYIIMYLIRRRDILLSKLSKNEGSI